MCSSYSGIVKQINEKNTLAMYVHCYAYILNLCVVNVCRKVMSIRNMFGTSNKMYAFLGAFSKSNLLFEKIQQKLNVKVNHLVIQDEVPTLNLFILVS